MSLLAASHLSQFYGADEVFSQLHLDIPAKARIALVGPNGAGKTSLLNILAGRDVPTEGRITKARHARVAYLPQRPELAGAHTLWQEQLKAFADLRTMEERLAELEQAMADGRETALADYGRLQTEFERRGGYVYETRIKRALSGVGFAAADYDAPLPRLSGGQKTRAMLCRLLLEEPDLLLLDEPTNHLDMDSQEILQAVLEGFAGTILLVSHDRYLIDALATQVWDMTAGQLTVFEGSYQEFLRRRLEEGKMGKQADKKPAAYADKKHGLNPYEVEQKVAQLETKISQLESSLNAIGRQLSAASAAGDAIKVGQLGAAYARDEAELEAALAEWSKFLE